MIEYSTMPVKAIVFKLTRAFLLMGVSLYFLSPFITPAFYDTNILSLTPKIIDPAPTKQSKFNSNNLGINLPWLDLGDGTQVLNWLNTNYNGALIEEDIQFVSKMGITQIRSFCQMESVFNYTDGKFILNDEYAANLDNFLDTAENHGLKVICVMGNGNHDGNPQDLDGFLRWEMLQSEAGLVAYKNAYEDYINRFKHHDNILMWEINNEPYSSITWSGAAQSFNITQDQVHNYLVMAYQTIKPMVGQTLVGFSDLEEKQQPKYRTYSDEAFRVKYIDDSTDVYSMHIYRMSADEIADFSNLTSKPKWVTELGAYNYDDPQAVNHPVPGHNELYDPDANYSAVTSIGEKLIDTGFTLIMPWSFTSNPGLVKHNPDGSHTLLKLGLYINEQLNGSAQE